MFRIEHNAETGEIKEIQLTAAEIAFLAKDADAPNPVKVLTAQEKFAALGLTADDFKALGL
jgi:hypothetical protein